MKALWKKFMVSTLIISMAVSSTMMIPAKGVSEKLKGGWDWNQNQQEEENTSDNTELDWFETELTLSESRLVMAVGTEGQVLTASEDENIIWTSSDSQVATVDSYGKVAPIKEGSAEITASIVENNKTRTATCEIIVTNPKLSTKKIDINMTKDPKAAFKINGMNPDYSNVDIEISDEETLSVWEDGEQYIIYAYKTGKYTLTIHVDGKVFTCPVTIICYRFNTTGVNLYPGLKKNLKVYGTSKKVVWKSSNSNIVSVTQKGEIKAKKKGTAKISATVNGATLNCYVAVADKKAIQALKKARSVIGSVYSQEKRMQKNYYDCSSLTWRSYSPYGVKMGASVWAPTAAEQARWCVDHKKVIVNGGIEASKLKLLPGDLIFYARGKNGRYKNISHVAMFAGYKANDGTIWGETDPVFGVIVEADGSYVSENLYYNYNTVEEMEKKIVLIARPLR